MGDPRSKPKAPKTKSSNAPHLLQEQNKLNSMKATQSQSKPQIQKGAARGR
jgi:hypothetical protein